MKYLILPLIILVTFACSEKKKQSTEKKTEETEWASQPPKKPASVEITNFKTKTGKEFTMVEKQLSASLSRITIQGSGFPNSQEIYTLNDSDPFEVAFTADLDKNGFEELYIILRSAGSGEYATIFGIASYNDLSYGSIYIPETTDDDPNFLGYMGHDRIRLTGNQLFRDIPVYNKGDTNSKPSGGYRTLEYMLEKGEAGYILKVKKATMHR